jgi:nitroreductase
MNFIEIAKKRCSVRRYKDKKVEPEKLQKILEAAHAAPTAANLQPVRLIVVQSAEGLAKAGKGANLYGAPLAIIVCADRRKAWVRPFDGKQTTDIDASILTDHMMLQATELGLGSVWICFFKPDVIRKEFGLPEELEPVNILALGYSDGEEADPDRHSRDRIPVEELVFVK